MENIPFQAIAIAGQSLGPGVCTFLDPFYLFKGKVRAAATRAKFHDSADLRMLAGKYECTIRSHAKNINLRYVGLALRRYIELERLFDRLGVDVQTAKHMVREDDLSHLPAPKPGDVQHGILG